MSLPTEKPLVVQWPREGAFQSPVDVLGQLQAARRGITALMGGHDLDGQTLDDVVSLHELVDDLTDAALEALPR